jgi:hypothetical protein
LASDGSTPAALKTNILTVELGSVGLEHALNSFAENLLDGEMAKAVRHVVSLFERLRGYRNYYGHGITFVLEKSDGPVGPVRSISAKGKLIESRDMITIDQLNWLQQQCIKLYIFTTKVAIALHPDEDEKGLPPLPSLPQRLEKKAIHFRELFPPQQGAPE